MEDYIELKNTPNYTYILFEHSNALQGNSMGKITSAISTIIDYTKVFPDVSDLSSILISQLTERKEVLRIFYMELQRLNKAGNIDGYNELKNRQNLKELLLEEYLSL